MKDSHYKIVRNRRSAKLGVAEEGIIVFVYGTLKKGFSNDKFLESSEFIGKAYTKNKFPMYIYKNGPYPFPYMLNMISRSAELAKGDKNIFTAKQLNVMSEANNVKGEVYKISDETLAKLDWLEGCPDFYFRREIKVIVKTDKDVCSSDNGTIMTAFCYFLTKGTEPFDQSSISEFI